MNKFVQYYRENIFLFPIFIMILGGLGRGIENSLLFLFLLTNLIVVLFLFQRKEYGHFLKHKQVMLLWLLIYLSWMMSIALNESYEVGLKEWLVSFLTSSTIMLSLLFYKQVAIQNLLHSKSVLYLVVFGLAVFFINLFSCRLNDNCEVRSSVTTLPVSLYFVFLAIPLYVMFERKWKLIFAFLSLFVFGFLLLSYARTEILMFLIMLLSFWAFFYKKFYLLFLAPFLLIFVILIYPLITTGHFYDFSIELKSFLYQTSSKRLETWELVFSNLPSNIYFGSGIGNTMAFLPENTLNDAFHNAFLEILYETGILGLFLFLSFIFVGFRNYFKVLGSNDSVDRHLYLIFQSSMMALMVAGFFEKGYMSMYFKFDFYYFVLMVYILGKQIVKSESSICKPC